MPLYRIEQISPNVNIGLWKIEEMAEELRAQQNLSVPEELYYKGLKNEVRKKHWLSYRLILKNIPGASGPLMYDEFGKPHLSDPEQFVSITHSGIFSGLIFSKDYPVGMDIEKMSDRIERVQDRFLSTEELQQLGEINRREKLYVCWGVKEALYKIHGKPDVEFTRDIITAPFAYTSGKGTSKAQMTVGNLTREYQLCYEEIEGYMLVYNVKC